MQTDSQLQLFDQIENCVILKIGHVSLSNFFKF